MRYNIPISTNFIQAVKMSSTERKNGAIVEGAIQDVAKSRDGVWYGHFTVGEVARYSRMSKPTVKKYLAMLIASGLVIEIERDMRYCAKNTTRSFRWVGA